jgi:hypothetical protein
VVFRKSVYEQTGYADEMMRQCGDWMMWVKMLLISDVAFVAEPLNYYRMHAGSVTHRNLHTETFARKATGWRVIYGSSRACVSGGRPICWYSECGPSAGRVRCRSGGGSSARL